MHTHGCFGQHLWRHLWNMRTSVVAIVGEAAAAAVPTGDGAAAGGHRSGSGSGGAHAAEDGASAGLGVEDKIAKVKEKNRCVELSPARILGSTDCI